MSQRSQPALKSIVPPTGPRVGGVGHRHALRRCSPGVRVAHHFVVRGGLIVRFEQFVDTALVREAMV